MKPLLIVANLKSHFTYSEAKNWLIEASAIKNQKPELEGKKIIVCPSFTLLEMFKEFIKEQDMPIELGAQNISRLPQGPYTGEVNGAQIKDFADFVIIGHSERRSGFGEDESIIEEKIKMAIDYGISPILCVQSQENNIPQGVTVVAYEPVFAVGTGNPDTPENAQEVAKKISEKDSVDYIAYGGSVTPENVKRFTSMENINGVLVGTDSLDAKKFIEIIKNA